MENIRYQVFVSSTYTDLKEERLKITQTLMEMDCIPAGMELFPAADEEQWEFIKKVIDDCDYYLLLIGGRYGSTTTEGISYTEKEYDYAVEIGLKVIVLVHGNPADLPFDKTEVDPILTEKLDKFRRKVSENRLVKFWEKSEDLPGIVALSLQKTIKSYPAQGWVRASKSSNQELLEEINELRKLNNELKDKNKELRKLQKVTAVENIADLDETFEFHGKYKGAEKYSYTKDWKVEVTWRELFSVISPYLDQNMNQVSVFKKIEAFLFEKFGKEAAYGSIHLNDQDFKTITIQFKALGLVNVNYAQMVGGGMGWFWSLTPAGTRLMMEERVIRSETKS